MTRAWHENVELIDDNDVPYAIAQGKVSIVDVQLTTAAGAITAGYVLADTQLISAAWSRANDSCGWLESIEIIDVAAQANTAMDVYLLDANVSMGTKNAAVTITGANSLHIIGKVTFLTTDFAALPGQRIATKGNLHIACRPVAGGRSLYLAAVQGSGSPTYGATPPLLRLGFTLD